MRRHLPSPASPTTGRAALLSLLLLSSPLLARPQDEVFVLDDERILGESHLGPMVGSYGRMVHGQFIDDLRNDAFLMVGEQPVLVCSPGFYHAFVNLPATGTDIAALQHSLPDGKDGLLLVSERGLELWWSIVDTNTFSSMQLGTTAWQDARTLRTGDTDGDGDPEVVGIGADGQSLIHLEHSTTPSEQVIAIGTAIHGIELLDWTGDGTLELAVLTAQALTIRGLGDVGVVQSFSLTSAPDDRLAVLRTAGFPNERLVVCMATTTAPQLCVYDMNGAEPTFGLDYPGVVGLACGDFDGDGADDLVVSQQTTRELIVMRNQRPGGLGQGGTSGLTFDLEPNEHTLLGNSELTAELNQCTPAIIDYDADGDTDILFANAYEKNVALKRNFKIDHEVSALALQTGIYRYNPGAVSGTLFLRVHVPPPPPAFNKLQIVLWRQPNAGSGTQREALSLRIEDRPLQTPFFVSVAVDESFGAEALRHVELRYLAVDLTTGEVLDQGPSQSIAFATSRNALQQVAVAHGFSVGDIVEIPWQFGRITAAQGGGPGSIPLGCVPCFYDDDIPAPRGE